VDVSIVLQTGFCKGCFKPGTPVVLVTGATRHRIATTLLLAKNGYKVWAGYRDPLKEKLMWKMLKGLKVYVGSVGCGSYGIRSKGRTDSFTQRETLGRMVNNAGFRIRWFLGGHVGR